MNSKAIQQSNDCTGNWPVNAEGAEGAAGPSAFEVAPNHLEAAGDFIEVTGSYTLKDVAYLFEAVDRALAPSPSVAKKVIIFSLFSVVLVVTQLYEAGGLDFGRLFGGLLMFLILVVVLGRSRGSVRGYLSSQTEKLQSMVQRWRLSGQAKQIELSSDGQITTWRVTKNTRLTVSPEGVLLEFQDPVNVILIPRSACQSSREWEKLVAVSERMVRNAG